MCGITGFNWEDKKLTQAMNKSIAYRGPDDKGVYTDKNISLGHQRLSILDTSKKGHQPFFGKNTVITYNGEIYNFKEIRTQLKKKGYRFSTQTDTEVILAAYEEYGVNCVDHFNGMFAFGVWDIKKKQLFLARDRLGINPLYYYWDGKKFVFASEPKAILKAGVKKRIDQKALYHYLTFGTTPRTQSIYQQIFKLPAGHYVLLKGKKLTLKKFWSVDFSHQPTHSEQYYVQHLRKHLEDAVQRRLLADVPVGSFLSGGIDSSAIVATIAKHKKNLNTFSVSFDDATLDERPYAEMVAQQFNTDHKNIYFSYSDVEKTLPKLAKLLDEPFADPAIISTYLVSRLARKQVTVSLSGDGGDESFLGYDRYKQYRFVHYHQKIPKIARSVMNLVSTIHSSTYQKIKRLRYLSTLSPDQQYAELRSNFSHDIRSSLFSHTFSLQVNKHYFRYKHYLNNLANTDINTNLIDGMLTKLDRASMYHGLEGRVPFLDHTFVEFSSTIPPHLKLKGNQGKYILKKALLPILPKKILYRKKQGFVFPIKQYIAGEMKDTIKNSLTNKSPLHKYVNKKEVEKLLTTHYSKKRDYSSGIWTLFMLRQWMDEYMT